MIDLLKSTFVQMFNSTYSVINNKIELRNKAEIPDGYLSKKDAHFIYGLGLSEKVFRLTMFTCGVSTFDYLHTAEVGHEMKTFAYKENEVRAAILLLKSDATQVTPSMCQSDILNGTRFRYTKELVS
mgnify:CR=1 FL=1